MFNGHGSPFDDGNGRFDNWMSMVNAGHPISAIGCSDDHGGHTSGTRNLMFLVSGVARGTTILAAFCSSAIF